MIIQQANSKDIDAVTSLVAEVSDTDVLPLFSSQGQQEYKQHVLPALLTALDDSRYVSVKAVSDGKLVGFASLRDHSYLMYLFVAKTCQGTGLGRQLLNYLLSRTSAREIHLRSSINAVGFYKCCGFKTLGDEAEINGIRFVPMALTL